MNAYQVLGVLQQATQEEIEQAYSVLVRRYGVFASPNNVKIFVAINAAYAILSNAETRRRHDQNAAIVPVAQSPRSFNPQSPQRDDANARSPESLGQSRNNSSQATQVTVHNHFYVPTSDGIDLGNILVGWLACIVIFGGIALSL